MFDIQGQLYQKQGNSNDLQRTEQWLEDRKGFITGSKVKDLMGCDRSASKKSWNDIEKVFAFSDSSVKYIYKTVMERIHRISDHKAESFAMKHGQDNEEKVKQYLLDSKIVEDIVEHGFLKYSDILGASPDGGCLYQNERVNLEIKSPIGWSGVYDRCEIAIDEKHMDFWQIQTEMLSAKVNKTLFVITYPLQWDKVELFTVDASPIHQKRIIQRSEIAKATYDLIIKTGERFTCCFNEAVLEYKNDIMS